MKNFKLSDILPYNDIVIQCHDHPDADTISSAFGIYTYLKRKGKEAKIIYSGYDTINKRNIQLMLEWLNIPVTHIKTSEISAFSKPGLLICVDCQYGEGNVTKIEADKIAVIDHHLKVIDDHKYNMGVIATELGSCATLIWELLTEEGFDFAADKDIPAALYYGLLTDTNNFSEISHPLDKDMRDELQQYCDRGIVRRLSLCNLTLEELELAGVALLRNRNCFHNRYALFRAEFCDPNILGFISDIALQVDTVDVCVVYSIREGGAKLSVRSCSREVMASEYVQYVTRGVGSGGGHRDKAGGWIIKAEVDALGMSIASYMEMKTEEYFKSYDTITASKHDIDVSSLEKFMKKPIPKGFVISDDVFEAGTSLMLRTLEGDSQVKASPDIYLMIGIKGEVYPIKAEKFKAYYKLTDRSVDLEEDIYTPTVKNEVTGEVKELIPYMKACISFGEAPIYAKLLERATKVFTDWNPSGYMYGKPGDYLAVKCDDINDVYIIENSIFGLTYEKYN